MALTSPSFTVLFDLDEDSSTVGKFVLEDTTDYVGEGITLADVTGYFNIVNNVNGNIHTGSISSPDIDGSVSFVFDTINIPTDANGDYVKDTYTFSYYITVVGAVQAGNYENVGNSFNFCPSVPDDPTITWSNNCYTFVATSTDTTNYSVTGISATPDFTVTRSHTVTPPANTGQTAQTTSAAKNVYSFTHSGGYDVTVDSALTVTSGIFTINARVKGTETFLINCDTDLCALYTCISTTVNDILTTAGNVGGLANIKSLPTSDYDRLISILTYKSLFEQAISCGKFDAADTYYAKLKEITQCDCGCTSGTEVRLVNTGSNSSSVTVVQAGSNINITTSVVGSTTTYTVAVDTALSAAVSANTSAIAALVDNKFFQISNSISDSGTTSGASGSVETLKSSTFNVTTYPVADGETVHATGRFTIAANTRSHGVGFQIFQSSVRDQVLVNLPSNSGVAQEVQVDLDIERVDADTIEVTKTFTWSLSGSSAQLLYHNTETISVSSFWASNFDIRMVGQNNDTPYTDDDVICTQLRTRFIDNA